MKRWSIIALVVLACAAADVAGTADSHLQPSRDATKLAAITDIVQEEIALGHIPGAVVLVGNLDGIVYERAIGRLGPGDNAPNLSTDTSFDLASLTKVVATTTAIMQLVERGKLELDAPVTQYWPAFAANGKQQITVRELLSHLSGLPPDLNLETQWHGTAAAMDRIATLTPVALPNARYIYSDVNFEVLGELVRRVSREPLDVYCQRHIFAPLGMKKTRFHAFTVIPGHTAPTYADVHRPRALVSDPTTFRMGGVAGHAGLFSTAGDLSIFARMMLGRGRLGAIRILNASSVDEMITPQTRSGSAEMHGLGWALAAPLASNRDRLPPLGSYYHLGYTGTFLLIDPVTGTYIVILSDRIYPHGLGANEPLRTRVVAMVSEAGVSVSGAEIIASEPWLSRFESGEWPHTEPVATGADVLESEHFAALEGLRIGLITNHTGVDRHGQRLIDLFAGATGFKTSAIFTPEHGLDANLDGPVPSGFESRTLLPVFSLYGTMFRPSGTTLAAIDGLVFDLQDAGARFFTYPSTMAYGLEAAAAQGIDFFVLDRPNPIDAAVVQGPLMDPKRKSFTGYFSLPVRHGMTIGELADLFNRENRINARLHIIRMRGYRRDTWYDDTGLRWIAPSPNLRTLNEATLYPGVAMIEGANVSVGRGTDTPFELVGAPWIDAQALADYLGRRRIAGVKFEAFHFVPAADEFRGERCNGVKVDLNDRDTLDSPALGIELISALARLYPKQFQASRTLGMVGSEPVLEEIQAGRDPREIVQEYTERSAKFAALRARYLLY